MKNLKENVSIYASIQIPLRIKYHTGQAARISKPLDNRVVEYLKKQIREGCRRTKYLQSRAKLSVDQTILLEESPTIF